MRILILTLVLVSGLLLAGCGAPAPDEKALGTKGKADAAAGPGTPQNNPKL